MFKKCTLRKAAELSGISDKTLKRWLQEDLGIKFPKVRRGAGIRVRERDVERVVARHRDARNMPLYWPRLRRQRLLDGAKLPPIPPVVISR